MTGDCIFFDLGDTLVTASLEGQPPRLRLRPLNDARGLLARLRAAGSRLGIISNTGSDRGDVVDNALAEAGLLAPFDASLRIYSGDFPGLSPKPSPDLFLQAKQRCCQHDRIRFVGEDAAEREAAAAAGFEALTVAQL